MSVTAAHRSAIYMTPQATKSAKKVAPAAGGPPLIEMNKKEKSGHGWIGEGKPWHYLKLSDIKVKLTFMHF